MVIQRTFILEIGKILYKRVLISKYLKSVMDITSLGEYHYNKNAIIYIKIVAGGSAFLSNKTETDII